MCLTIWAPYLHYWRNLSRKIGLIGSFAPSLSYTSGHVISENWKMHVHSQTMQKMRVGNAKPIYHSQWEKKKNCTSGCFCKRSKWMKRVSRVLITYHGSRLKCQCSCSASEKLKCFSRFWLRKGRYSKKCELLRMHFRKPTTPCQVRSGDDADGGSSDKVRRQMDWCFLRSLPRLPSSPPRAQPSSVPVHPVSACSQ